MQGTTFWSFSSVRFRISLNILFNYHLLYFCTALSLIIMLSSHYYLHKSKTLSQLTQCPFTGTLLLFTKWCHSNQVDFRAPPLKSIADFLLYLFQDRKLQPSTIDGYRSAIADKLGNSSVNVSKDENLTRLLDSFHRDRPKGRRNIPSWNLSLVLHQLTKAIRLVEGAKQNLRVYLIYFVNVLMFSNYGII